MKLKPRLHQHNRTASFWTANPRVQDFRHFQPRQTPSESTQTWLKTPEWQTGALSGLSGIFGGFSRSPRLGSRHMPKGSANSFQMAFKISSPGVEACDQASVNDGFPPVVRASRRDGTPPPPFNLDFTPSLPPCCSILPLLWDLFLPSYFSPSFKTRASPGISISWEITFYRPTLFAKTGPEQNQATAFSVGPGKTNKQGNK